jgi:hypothetical protein
LGGVTMYEVGKKTLVQTGAAMLSAKEPAVFAAGPELVCRGTIVYII